MMIEPAGRPKGLTALSLFFWAGAAISGTSCLALLSPGGPLEPMWRLNPRARGAFGQMGVWAIVLMAVVCVACGAAAIGLWRGASWGRRLAIGILAVNLVGDAANVALGTEPRAAFGLPIAGAMLAYLSRLDFTGSRRGAGDTGPG